MGQIKRFTQIFNGLMSIKKLLAKSGDQAVNFSIMGPSIVKILNNLGPTFIKLGQMLSLRPDIIPSDLADELRRLLDHGIPAKTEEVSDLFKSETGKTPSQFFDNFEETPFAVASLAQVHKAVYQGKVLAVKIQKPNIHSIILQDLNLIKKLTFVLSFNSKIRKFKPMIELAITEFYRWIEKELDYRLEALNIERINKNFSHIKYFRAPKVEHFLSSKKILAMEYIDGVSLNELFDNIPNLSEQEIIRYKNINFKKDKFIDHAINIVFKQIFEDGIFHADPHPGNIFITKDNDIVFIDFGIIGILQPTLRKSVLEIFLGIIERDINKISQSLAGLDEIEGHALIPEIETRVRQLLDEWQSGSIIEMTTVEVFYQLVKISLESKIDLPYSIVIIGKTLLEYDGGLRKLEPSLDIINSFKGIIEKKYGMDIMNFGQENKTASMNNLLDLMRYLPTNLQTFAQGLIDNGLEFSVRFGPANGESKRVKQ